MKKKILVTLTAVALSSVILSAGMNFILYGFKIGQDMKCVTAQLGGPYKVQEFGDGFKAYIYKFKDHYLVFETDGSRPDIIWGIQLAGSANPAGMGLNGLNLGDDIKSMHKLLGKPDSTEKARDEITGDEVDNTILYSYMNTGNMSVETVDSKVSSIKISYNGIVETPVEFNLSPFIAAVKTADSSRIAPFISSELAVSNKGDSYLIRKSVYESLSGDRIIKDILFNKEYGVAVAEKNCKIEERMRILDNGLSGKVFIFTRDKMQYELLFIRSFDGWVLYEINVF